MRLFLSFNKADIEFARWIAWNVERSGCDVVFQEWDFAPATDFVEQMRRGLDASDKLIAVLSPDYLNALYTHAEWHEFFHRDPTGEKRLLLLLRVAECDPGPLLNTRVHVDLFGCDEAEARRRLLASLRGDRRKPKRSPRFPEAHFPQPVAPDAPGYASVGSANGGSALEVLADLYHLARRRSDDLIQLHSDADAWQRYRDLRKKAAKSLKVGSRLTLTMQESRAMHDADPALLAATLHAVAAACRDRLWEAGPQSIRTSAAFGSVEYRVAPDDTPFPGDFPRHLDDLSTTLESLYLSDIRLVPAEIEGTRLASVELGPAARLRLRECRQTRVLRIALSSLGGEAELAGERLAGFPDGEPRRFRLTEVRNVGAEQANLIATLQQASEAGAAILVLPELRVTPAMEGAAREFLSKGRHSLALVVAGSWHYADDLNWINRSSVLGARGEIVWQHSKPREYHATAQNVAAAPEFYGRIDLDANGGSEGIVRGRVLQYCDTPAGRLCVAICIGFFHPEIRAALAASRADYFLVPAMTASATELHIAADSLARAWAATLVANCGVVGPTAPCFSRKPFRNEAVRDATDALYFVDFSLC